MECQRLVVIFQGGLQGVLDLAIDRFNMLPILAIDIDLFQVIVAMAGDCSGIRFGLPHVADHLVHGQLFANDLHQVADYEFFDFWSGRRLGRF